MTLRVYVVWRSALRHAVVIVPLLAFGMAVHAWLQPGVIAGSDFHAPALSTMDELQRFFPWPSAWDPTTFLGHSLQIWMPYFPVWSLASLLTRLGCSWPLVERILWLFPILVLFVFASYCCFLSLTGIPAAAAAGSTVFALNTWTIGLIQRGHIPSLVAYGFFPVVLLGLVRYLREPSRFRAVLLAIALWLPVAYDIRYAVLALWMTAPVLIAVLIHRLRSGQSKRGIALDALFFGMTYFGANAYWVVPSILAAPTLPQQYVSADAFASLSSFESWTTAIAAYYPFYHHMAGTNGFKADLPSPGFFAVTLCFIAGIVLNWGRRLSRWCLAIWLAAVVFESGAGGVFGAINGALFQVVPTLSMFRDVSKILALCTFMSAIGIALFVSSTQYLSSRRLPVPLLVLLITALGYTATMHDAYSPYRFSNFSVSKPSADEVALRNYLSLRPPGRVLYMPATDEFEPGTDAHPAATISATMTFGIPNGVGAVSPDEESLFGLLRSPLASALLCQLGVRYVVATYDDRGLLYTPWEANYQYHEGLAFLRARPYLHEVHGVSRDVPFEVLGCKSAPFAYSAPLPLAFIGTGNQLEALAGTPFWNQRAGVVIAEDVTNANTLGSFDNVVVGALPVDPALRAYTGPLSALLPQWAAATTAATYEPRSYRAFLATRLGTSSTFRYEDELPYVNARFVDPYSGSADVLAVISPRRKSRGVIVRRNFTTVARIDAAPLGNGEVVWDSTTPSATLDVPAPSVALWRSPSEWVALGVSPLEFAIRNTGPTAVRANVVFPGFVALRGATSDVSVQVVGGSSERTVHAFSRYLFEALGVKSSLTFQDVVLQPGTTFIRVSAVGRNTVPIGVDRRVEVTNVESIGQYVAPQPLDVSVVTTAQGIEFVPPTAGTESAANAPFRLLSELHVPLSRHPVVRVRYVAPPHPLSLALSFELRRSDGYRVTFGTNLPGGATVYEVPLFETLQESLVASDERQRQAHVDDIAWNIAHRLHPYPEASAYELQAVNIVFVKPPGAATDPSQIARVHDVSVDVAATPVFNGPVEVDYHHADMRTAHYEKSAALSALHVTRKAATADRVDLAFILPPSPQAAVPDRFSVGDTVAVNLTNGSLISGVVFRAEPDVVVIRRPEGVLTGVEIRNIVSISSVMAAPAHGLSIVVPITTTIDRGELSYDIAPDPSIAVHPSLQIDDGATGQRTWVAPLDNPDLAHAEHGIPTDWVALLPDPLRSEPTRLGDPIVLSHRSSPAESYKRVSLPLDEIVAYQVPTYRKPLLRALRLTIEASGASSVGESVATISIANVATHRFEDEGDGPPNPRSFAGLVSVDERLPKLSSFTMRKNGIAEIGGTIRLTGGDHIIRSVESGRFNVDAVLISQGSPRSRRGADAVDGRRLSDSEWSCSIDADGGLLVWPQLYDSGWRAAVLEDADPSPTGNMLVDFWRARHRVIGSAQHVPVNGGLNGWLVPHLHGRVIFFYLPTLYSVLAAPAGFALVLMLLKLSKSGPRSHTRKLAKS